MAVERLNYFTGLFLDESDFKLEQDYHLLMRRRLNFGFVLPGVLFGLDVVRVTPDSVRINPGMAIDRHEVESQAREIVLTDSQLIDLSTFANDTQVYIVISYNQVLTVPKPPLNIASRITEEPIVKPFRVTELPGDRNLTIILAKVTVGDISAPDLSERQLARLRLGGGGTPGGPTVTSLSFSNAPRQGSNVQMTINGANLAESPPQVTILDTSNNPDTHITATIEGASSNTELIVNLIIAPTAALGDRRVRVQTDRGTVTTDPAGATAFEVFPPGPVILGIAPNRGRRAATRTVTITGHNLAENPIVSILKVNANETDREISVTLGAVTPDSITATITITNNADLGGRRVRIQTDGGGETTSPPNFFTVQPVPVIKSFSPTVTAPKITINGSDIRSELPGQPSATEIRFVDPTNSENFAPGINPIVLQDVPEDVGPQVIEVGVPAQGTLPEVVQLTLEIDGTTTTADEVFTFI